MALAHVRASVVLAEDHPLMAAELRDLLERDFHVLEVVADGCALIDAVHRHAPHALVVDVSMPNKDGIAAVEEILRDRPSLPVVFVSVHGDAVLVAKALAIGARGYVLKHAAADELAGAVEAALRGDRHVSPGLSRRTSS